MPSNPMIIISLIPSIPPKKEWVGNMWTLSNPTILLSILYWLIQHCNCKQDAPYKVLKRHTMHCMKFSTYTIIHAPYMHCTCTVRCMYYSICWGLCNIFNFFQNAYLRTNLFNFPFFVVLFQKILATKHFWIALFFTVAFT